MNNKFKKIFSTDKPIIGMVHLPASPGQPQAQHRVDLIQFIQSVKQDVLALQSGGVDGLLFCNESDLPYTTKLSSEVSAWAGFLIGSLYDSIKMPFGVNLLWDPIASIETAAATGANFVREVMCGSFATDMGLLSPDPALVTQTRTRLKAEHIALFTNIVPEFATALAGRSVAQLATAAEYFGFDAILISGPVAGVAFDAEHLKEAQKVVKNTPILANTGVKIENLAETLAISNGAIVGSSLKIDGKTFNPVDPLRVKEFILEANRIRNL
ncbi:MAG: BtpA/SgcQ family protein [Actinobacteria bacterium]|nr:BtpA/SgcQ family protein [Actinomycetota bacterium]